MAGSILVFFAHPDDEIGIGPLVSRSVAEGVRVTLVCATNGDLGTVDEHLLYRGGSIADLRLAELRCATAAIGFSEVVTWGYRDSGMAGSVDNDHPDSFHAASLDDLTRRLIEEIRRVRPQILITFNTFGAYGHPDHIQCNRVALAAMARLGNQDGAPQKLYYTTVPTRGLRFGLRLMRLIGRDPRRAGRNRDVDLHAALEAACPVTTRVEAADYADQTWRAIRSYRSQINPLFTSWLVRTLGRRSLGTVSLSLVYPRWQTGKPLERNVFDGIVRAELPTTEGR